MSAVWDEIKRYPVKKEAQKQDSYYPAPGIGYFCGMISPPKHAMCFWQACSCACHDGNAPLSPHDILPYD